MAEFETGGPGPSGPPAPVSRRRKRAHSGPFHFSMGAALARALRCFGQNFVPLSALALVLFAPLAFMMVIAGEKAWFQAQTFTEDYGLAVGFNDLFWTYIAQNMGFAGRLVELGLPLILQATVTLGVFQYLRGSKLEMGRSISRGLARFFPVLGVAIFTGLIAVLALIPTGLLISGMASSGSLAGAIIGGLIALVVVFLILCVFFVAPQSTIVEHVGPSKAMSRSSELTRGARWKIFAILLIVGVVGFIADLIIQRVFVGDDPSSWSSARLGIIVSVAVTAILAVFQAICAAVVYHDLRHAKEGVGLDELLDVFD